MHFWFPVSSFSGLCSPMLIYTSQLIPEIQPESREALKSLFQLLWESVQGICIYIYT